MIRISSLTLCLPLVSVSLQAETVMISIRNDQDSGYITEERAEHASAIEDGAMEQFFDSDHIVFNMGLNIDEGSEDAAIEGIEKVATGGGAGFVFDIRTGEPDPTLLAPAYIRYSLLDLRRESVITEGSVTLADVLSDDTKSPVAICFLMGTRAAVTLR